MYNQISDYSKIQDGRQMLALTSVAGGTLASLISHSNAFGQEAYTRNPETQDKVLKAWQLFTQYNIDQGNVFSTWQDAWNAFVEYATTEACRRFSDMFEINDLPYPFSCEWVSTQERVCQLPGDNSVSIFTNGLIYFNGDFYGHSALETLDGQTKLIERMIARGMKA